MRVSAITRIINTVASATQVERLPAPTGSTFGTMVPWIISKEKIDKTSMVIAVIAKLARLPANRSAMIEISKK